MPTRTLVTAALLVLAALVAAPASAQVNEQRSGTIESIDGTTMVLGLSTPPRRLIGTDTAPPPRPKLVVDLDDVPASQWVFLKPGERIAVVGVTSADGQHFAAIAVIGGAGPRREPQAP